MERDARELHDAYRRLADRASSAGLIPEGGLTPREQQAELIARAAVPPGQVERLVALLERCVYGRGGDERDVEEAMTLCAALGAMMPDPPPARERRFRLPWFRALPVLVPVAMIAGVILLLVKFPPSCSATLNVERAATWRMTHESEIAATERATSDTWTKPPAQVTWTTVSIPETLASTAHEAPRGIDLDTGTDGVYPNAEDPCSPPLGWTHRRRVFDRVDDAFGLYTSPEPSIDAPRGSTGDGPRHRVEVKVLLEAGRPVAVPSSAPNAVLLESRSSPAVRHRFVKDAADALFVIGEVTRRVELTYLLGSEPGYRSAPLSADPFVPQPIALPPNVRRDAEQVAAAIGDLPAPTYAETVRRLHAYFAGFSVAPLSAAEHRENDYLSVALARKGVCRHRARAFFITASALGVPTRVAENRTHSFCEVRQPDGRWRRLEFRLGAGEGAPAPATDHLADAPLAAPFLAAVRYLLCVLVIVAVVAALMRSVRTDTSGHRVPEPAGASRAGPTPRATPADLLRFVLDQVRAWRDRPSRGAPEVPDQVGARLEHLRGTAAEPPEAWAGDARRLQRLYWDSYYVLEWLKERDAL